MADEIKESMEALLKKIDMEETVVYKTSTYVAAPKSNMSIDSMIMASHLLSLIQNKRDYDLEQYPFRIKKLAENAIKNNTVDEDLKKLNEQIVRKIGEENNKKDGLVIPDTKDYKIFHLVLSIATIIFPNKEYTVPIVKKISSTIYDVVSMKKTYGGMRTDIEKCTRDALKLLSGEKQTYILEYLELQDSKIIELLNNYTNSSRDKDIENLEETLINLLSQSQIEKLNQMFVSAFRTCLYSYVELQSALTYSNVDVILAAVMNFGNFMGNEFLHKLHNYGSSDGMMKYLYELFQEYFIKARIPDDIVNTLAHLQDVYNNAYKLYQDHGKISIENNDLARFLISKEMMRLREMDNLVPLIKNYIQFVIADCQYFQGFYEKAVENYSTLKTAFATYKREDLEHIYKQIDLYLINSIGWSLYLNNESKEALQWLKKLYEDPDALKKSDFSCVYRRNYGVCLDKMGKLQDAIDEFNDIILNCKKLPNEFKVYINYCSSTMKYWDIMGKKTSGKWKETIRDVINKRDDRYINLQNIQAMHVYLDMAERINGLFPGLVVQKLKLLTYEILLCDNDKKIAQLEEEAYRLILTLNIITSSTSKFYVIRDFYYAMSVVSSCNEDIIKYLDKSWEANEKLNAKGDSSAFTDMLRGCKSV